MTDSAAINEKYFSEKSLAEFIEGSPHLKHEALRKLCDQQARAAFDAARSRSSTVAVLDMGAGEGALTLRYLEWGAHVIATDATPDLLEELQRKAAAHRDRLTVLAGDIFATLERMAKEPRRFDVICASSFLHHIPDYLELFRRAMPLLAERGVIFTFQDPLRYDSLGRGTLLFDRLSYFGWRLFQGNYLRGLKTRLRRLAGIYRADLEEDSAEYHVVRNGVDQEAISALFAAGGFDCQILRYWSTQSSIFQKLGHGLGLKNTFAVMAQKRSA